MELVEQLMNFGLTRQEAIVYLFLIEEGEATGYEAAKQTGISRSNTYTTLAGLVEKGAAYLSEGNVTKYMPVSAKEFCDNKLKALQTTKSFIINHLPDKKQNTKNYITITGEQHIFDKLTNMLLEAKERVYISTSLSILQEVEPYLKELVKKEIKVVVLAEPEYCLEGATVYYRTRKMDGDQIRLIVDSLNVLTGEAEKNRESTCLYSKNKNLIDVFKEMLKNEITLIQIENENKGEEHHENTICNKREVR